MYNLLLNVSHLELLLVNLLKHIFTESFNRWNSVYYNSGSSWRQEVALSAGCCRCLWNNGCCSRCGHSTLWFRSSTLFLSDDTLLLFMISMATHIIFFFYRSKLKCCNIIWSCLTLQISWSLNNLKEFHTYIDTWWYVGASSVWV